MGKTIELKASIASILAAYLVSGGVLIALKLSTLVESTKVLELIFQSLVLFLVYLFFWFQLKKGTYEYLGIRKPETKYYLYALFVGTVILVLQYLLASSISDHYSNLSNGVSLLWKESSFLFLLVLVDVIVYPVSEELIFRGALFTAIKNKFNLVLACIVPSVLWAFLHFDQYNYFGLLFFFAYGVVLSFFREKSLSIIPGLIVHVLINMAWFIYLTNKLA